MLTWAEVKQKVENAGIKDTEPVRSFEIFFALDRTDFTYIKLAAPVERGRVLDAK